jgi:hypothetical protein
MDEYDLSLDDIRWYLSQTLAESLLTHVRAREELVKRIWSGRLEAELYNMEEAWLQRLADELDRGLTDEQSIRDQLERARMLKIQRR